MSFEQVYQRISSSGAEGLPKMKLKKEFGIEVDKILDQLLSKGRIFMDKKGRSTNYWSKDNYVKYLASTDPRFRLILDIYSSTNNSVVDTISRINDDLHKKVESVTSEFNNKVNSLTSQVATSAREVSASNNGNNYNGNHDDANAVKNRITMEQFQMEFDRTLMEIPTSIGWVELAAVRERICDKYGISKQNFYSLASQLFDQHNNRYELSSGGNEGVTVRGLVHGFVRCI